MTYIYIYCILYIYLYVYLSFLYEYDVVKVSGLTNSHISITTVFGYKIKYIKKKDNTGSSKCIISTFSCCTSLCGKVSHIID